jgi:hypothetical protein
MRRFVAALALTLAAGCQNNFDPASYLAGDLRVLGVVAEPPDVPGGATSKLTPIVASTGGATPSFAWALCLDPPPAGSAAVNPDCLTQDTADFLIPVAGAESAVVTMPQIKDPKMFGLPDATIGVYLPVRVRVQASDQNVQVIYRLRVTLPGFPANQNPVIDQVLDSTTDVPTPIVEGQPYPAPAGPIKLRLTLADGSDEMYPTITGDAQNPMIEMKTEEPRFFWYADFGSFSDNVTGEAMPDTTLDLGDEKHPAHAGDTVNVWVVVHDDRGGTAVAHRQLAVQ